MYQTRGPISSIHLPGSMVTPSYEAYGMYNPYGIGANLGYPVPQDVYLNNVSSIPWTTDQSWRVSTGMQQFDIIEDGQVYDNAMEEYAPEAIITEDGQIISLSGYENNGKANVANLKNGPIEKDLALQSLYKTELCRSYEETGSCRYGAKCQFAHGEEELRPVLRHPKYKTQVCKAFHSTGTCHYGSRCRFIHIRPDEPLPGEYGSPQEDGRWEEKDELNSSPHTPSNSPPTNSPISETAEIGSPARRLAIFRSFTSI